MTVKKANWDSLPAEIVRSGVTRKSFSGTGATVCLNYLKPGHEPRPHSHPHEQITYIISGWCEFHIGDDVVLMGPGDIAVIPGGMIHYGVVVGDEEVVNLDVFTPRRVEYGG